MKCILKQELEVGDLVFTIYSSYCTPAIIKRITNKMIFYTDVYDKSSKTHSSHIIKSNTEAILAFAECGEFNEVYIEMVHKLIESHLKIKNL